MRHSGHMREHVHRRCQKGSAIVVLTIAAVTFPQSWLQRSAAAAVAMGVAWCALRHPCRELRPAKTCSKRQRDAGVAVTKLHHTQHCAHATLSSGTHLQDRKSSWPFAWLD
jgi:hypothetical protein